MSDMYMFTGKYEDKVGTKDDGENSTETEHNPEHNHLLKTCIPRSNVKFLLEYVTTNITMMSPSVAKGKRKSENLSEKPDTGTGEPKNRTSSSTQTPSTAQGKKKKTYFIRRTELEPDDHETRFRERWRKIYKDQASINRESELIESEMIPVNLIVNDDTKLKAIATALLSEENITLDPTWLIGTHKRLHPSICAVLVQRKSGQGAVMVLGKRKKTVFTNLHKKICTVLMTVKEDEICDVSGTPSLRVFRRAAGVKQGEEKVDGKGKEEEGKKNGIEKEEEKKEEKGKGSGKKGEKKAKKEKEKEKEKEKAGKAKEGDEAGIYLPNSNTFGRMHYDYSYLYGGPAGPSESQGWSDYEAPESDEDKDGNGDGDD